MSGAVQLIARLVEANEPGKISALLLAQAIGELAQHTVPDSEIAITRIILEACLDTARKADGIDAPFGMFDPEHVKIWHAGRAEAFRHALEMLPSRKG